MVATEYKPWKREIFLLKNLYVRTSRPHSIYKIYTPALGRKDGNKANTKRAHNVSKVFITPLGRKRKDKYKSQNVYLIVKEFPSDTIVIRPLSYVPKT